MHFNNSSSYTVVLQQRQPINILASNLIKCASCDQYFPQKQIRTHMSIHIDAQYKCAKGSKQRGGKEEKKVNLKNVLQENEGNEWADEGELGITVRSFLPEDMPAVDSVRKNVKKQPDGKLNHQSKLLQQILKQRQNKQNVKPDQLDVFSHFDDNEQVPETSSILNIKKQIKIIPVSMVNPKRVYNLYENTNNIQNGHHYDFEQKKSKSKKQQHIETPDIQPYQIILMPKSPNKPIPIQIKKYHHNPVRKQLISTCSTGQGFFTGTQSKQTKNKLNSQYDHENQSNNQNLLENQCAGCHGFYCKQCGSDIPPIFRPVPGKKYKESAKKQQIQKFYKDHVYAKQNAQNCRNCV